MTNLEKLIEIIKSNNGVELYNWMEKFAYWVDPGGYFDIGDWAEYSEEECNVFDRREMVFKMDKRFEHDYIRRWRVIAMLENIKTHLNDNNLPQIVDNYIKFSKEIDEYKWELENR